MLTTQLCSDTVVVGVEVELDVLSVDDVTETGDVVISQWRDVYAYEEHQYRDRVDEILRPLGVQTRLIAIEHSKINSIAVYVDCLTFATVMSLRDHWRSKQLRNIVQSLIALLSGAARTVLVKRLAWPLNDFERQLNYFSSVRG